MKTVLKNYTFSTSGKTITCTDIATVRLDRLALITDVTTGKILYNFADTSTATATVATNVITLSVLQGGENTTDKLRIDYDTDTADTAFGDSTNATKLVAGSAIVGKVTTDQTTHGTTDLVAADITKIGGTAVDTNSGNKSAGTQRVVIATDQPALTNAQPANITQVAGATIAQGHGTAAAAIRVELPTDSTGVIGIVGGKTNNNAAPGATNIGTLPAIANAAVQTWTEGDQVAESVDLAGNQRMTLGTALSQAIDSILSYPVGHSYANFTAAQTATQVKSGAGTLHAIVINTPVASGTIEYDDALSHTNSMGKITFPGTLVSDGPIPLVLDIAFSTGLNITTTGTMDLTFIYR